MVELEFIDGSKEQIESDGKSSYVYDKSTSMFKVRHDGYWIMYPREFVKSIRYIPVNGF